MLIRFNINHNDLKFCKLGSMFKQLNQISVPVAGMLSLGLENPTSIDDEEPQTRHKAHESDVISLDRARVLTRKSRAFRHIEASRTNDSGEFNRVP
jgi:hypothetical protein